MLDLAYAVYCASDTMWPVFSYGMQLIVDPGLDAVPGDDVVVTLAGCASIMRLVSIDAAEVIGRQFNPMTTLRFDRSEVVSIEPVVFSRHRLPRQERKLRALPGAVNAAC